MARADGPDVVVALQASGLLNSEVSLRQIAQAAQKIPGLGEGGEASWELITRDFVYRGAEGRSSLDERSIAGLQESGIVNFDLTLGEILEIGSRIPAGGNPVAWELISRDFVLRGKFAEMVEVGL